MSAVGSHPWRRTTPGQRQAPMALGEIPLSILAHGDLGMAQDETVICIKRGAYPEIRDGRCGGPSHNFLLMHVESKKSCSRARQGNDHTRGPEGSRSRHIVMVTPGCDATL